MVRPWNSRCLFEVPSRFAARAGDGEADDTEAFRQAIAASDKVFVPKGHYRLTQMLELGRNTHLFGLGATQTSIGGSGGAARGPGFAAWQDGRTRSATFIGGPEAAKPNTRHLPLSGSIALRRWHPSLKLPQEGRTERTIPLCRDQLSQVFIQQAVHLLECLRFALGDHPLLDSQDKHCRMPGSFSGRVECSAAGTAPRLYRPLT